MASTIAALHEAHAALLTAWQEQADANTRSKPTQQPLRAVLILSPVLPTPFHHRDLHGHGTEGQGFSLAGNLSGCRAGVVTEGGLALPSGIWSSKVRGLYNHAKHLSPTFMLMKIISKGL